MDIKYCECGCGVVVEGKTTKGTFRRFVNGHNARGNKINLGKKWTDEQKKKHSENLQNYWKDNKLPDRYCIICNKKLCNSARWQKYVNYCRKCYILSPGFINKKTSFVKGHIGWKTGKKFPYTPCPAKQGEKNYGWKGGITPKTKLEKSSSKYRRWANAVKDRDNRECVLCKSKENLHADHIKSWALYPDIRYDLDNGRTLCWECHKKTDSYAKPSKYQK